MIKHFLADPGAADGPWGIGCDIVLLFSIVALTPEELPELYRVKHHGRGGQAVVGEHGAGQGQGEGRGP